MVPRLHREKVENRNSTTGEQFNTTVELRPTGIPTCLLLAAIHSMISSLSGSCDEDLNMYRWFGGSH